VQEGNLGGVGTRNLPGFYRTMNIAPCKGGHQKRLSASGQHCPALPLADVIPREVLIGQGRAILRSVVLSQCAGQSNRSPEDGEAEMVDMKTGVVYDKRS
jgi:hypothetical protein